MKRLNILIIILFYIAPLFAQNNYKLEGEGSKDNVKLLWSVDKWPQELQGVYIKRRSISGNGEKSSWVQLNEKVMVIGVSKDKELSNTTNNKQLISQLTKKRSEYLKNKQKGTTQIKEVEQEVLQKELENPDAFTMLMLFFYYDFDVAMLYGFGYTDEKLLKADSYEYGLFPVLNGAVVKSPVASFQWKYGDEPDLNVKIKKERIKKRKKNIHLTWIFDTKDYDSKKIAGFNIYRKPFGGKEKKLNENSIWLNKANEKRTLFYKDSTVDIKKSYTYFAVPVSIFKNEGKKLKISYNPKEHELIRPPLLSTTVKPGEDFTSNGVKLTWKFEESKEDRISGFSVERRVLPKMEFETVSDKIDPSSRKFIDKNPLLSKGQTIIYRVSALQEESYPLWSNTIRLFYNPKPDLSKKKVNAKAQILGNDVVVDLTWEGKALNPKVAKGYCIYSDRAGGILAYESAIAPIGGNSYQYKVEGLTGTKYQFAVGIVDNDDIRTIISDTISVVIPSKTLPHISIWPITTKEEKVTINWKYRDNIADLAGFRIYQNDILVADQQKVKKESRSWTTPKLEPGKYNFQIEAVSSFGVSSKRSSKVKSTITAAE